LKRAWKKVGKELGRGKMRREEKIENGNYREIPPLCTVY